MKIIQKCEWNDGNDCRNDEMNDVAQEGQCFYFTF